ncbi:MAG: purine nucleoside phosphorylase [Rhodothermales bacterium]|jgi:purine nucleoside phosphorylase
MIAIIGGTSLLESAVFAHVPETRIETAFGEVVARQNNELLFVQRHGPPPHTPPHRINHHANIDAIAQAGVRDIIAVNSTGSLKADLPPGELVVPDDYFKLFELPTFFEETMRFTVPGLGKDVRQRLVDTARSLEIPVRDGGVYCHVRGPILETPAEIRFLATIGDIVGMTMAHEAILARERDLNYASVCMIDNFANGIGGQRLTLDQIDGTRAANLAAVERLLTALLA